MDDIFHAKVFGLGWDFVTTSMRFFKLIFLIQKIPIKSLKSLEKLKKKFIKFIFSQ